MTLHLHTHLKGRTHCIQYILKCCLIYIKETHCLLKAQQISFPTKCIKDTSCPLQCPKKCPFHTLYLAFPYTVPGLSIHCTWKKKKNLLLPQPRSFFPSGDDQWLQLAGQVCCGYCGQHFHTGTDCRSRDLPSSAEAPHHALTCRRHP